MEIRTIAHLTAVVDAVARADRACVARRQGRGVLIVPCAPDASGSNWTMHCPADEPAGRPCPCDTQTFVAALRVRYRAA